MISCVYWPVADGGLRFDGEEQRSAEVVHVADARLPVVVVVVVGVPHVAVRVCNAQPDRRERRPTDNKSPDTSYTSSDIQKHDSYTARGRITGPLRLRHCNRIAVKHFNTNWSGENAEFSIESL